MAVYSLVMSLYLFLKSKKLALVSIGLLTFFSVIGMTIPQASLDLEQYQRWAYNYNTLAPLAEKMGFHRIFSSGWFLTIAFIFLVNLSLCTMAQIYQSWKQQLGLRSWGKTIFHIGLLLIVIGGFVSTGFKSSGFMIVGEGETRKESHEHYRSIEEGILFREDMHAGYKITLLKQNLVLTKEGQVDYVRSHVEVRENGKKFSHWVEKGSPMVHKNYRLFHNISGYALPVVIKNQTGEVIFGSYLILNTEQQADKARFFVFNQPLNGTGYSVNLELFPDAVLKNDNIIKRSNALKNPLIKVEVRDRQGRQVRDVLGLNQSITLGNGDTLILAGRINRWVGLDIVNDPGARVLFSGGWIALLGTIIYFTQGLQLKVKEA